MKTFGFLSLLFIFSACHYLENSFKQLGISQRPDKKIIQNTKPITPPVTEPKPVESNAWEKMYQVFQTKCQTCHTSFGSSPSSFLAGGLAIPQKPAESKLVFRLKNNPYLKDEKLANMPKNLEISEQEIQVFIDWVNSLQSDDIPKFSLINNKKIIEQDELIDIGVHLASTPESLKVFSIKNLSKSDVLVIDEISLAKGTDFSIADIESYSIKPGSTSKITISFKTTSLEKVNDRLQLFKNGREIFSFQMEGKASQLLTETKLDCVDSSTKKIYDYIKPLTKTRLDQHLKNIIDPKVEDDFALQVQKHSLYQLAMDLYPNISQDEFRNDKQGGFSPEHISGIAHLSLNMAQIFSTDRALFDRLMLKVYNGCWPSAGVDNISKECINYLIYHWARYAWSRNPTEQEYRDLQSISNYYYDKGDRVKAFESVIAGILMDIKTWGYFDFGAEAISNTEFRRSKTGWLRSLSFALTDSSPDEKAIQLAENVDFEQKDSIKPLVTHLMNRKNHAGERMASLKIHSILSHYLQFENNKGLGSSIPLKEGLLKSYQQKGVDVNQTMFGHHGADGIQADSKLLKFLIEDLEVNIDQILDAPYKVALNELQKYVTKAKEISPLAQKIEGVPGTGIFYHFAMLTGTTNSFYRSPPKTAAAVIEKFGCQHIGSPEDVPDLDPEDIKPPVIDPNLTITQNFNDATSQSNACLSCHKVMNRYSDVLQQVNAVGEVTDQEVFYDQSGMATHQHSLDTFANLNLHGQFFVAKNFYDFPKIFQETGSFALCVAKEAVKTLYLNNDEKKLACEIKSGFEQLMNKSTKVNEILELMIEQPNFQKINIDPER